MHEVIMHKTEAAVVRARNSHIILSSSMFKNCVPVLLANVQALNAFSTVWKEKYFFSPRMERGFALASVFILL